MATTDKAAWRTRPEALVPWILLAIGIPASFVLSSVVEESVENVARLRFEREASDAKAVIEHRINFYADILYGLKAAAWNFTASCSPWTSRAAIPDSTW
jgi:CHASE1-domain containing sensor protein